MTMLTKGSMIDQPETMITAPAMTTPIETAASAIMCR